MKKASYKWKLKRSLSFRIFFLCFLFLIIPLVVHTFFLYREEYEEALNDTFSSLFLFSRDRAYFLEEILEKEKNLFTLFSEEIPSLSPDSFLEERAKLFSIPFLFLVEKRGGQWRITHGSLKEGIGKLFPLFPERLEETLFVPSKKQRGAYFLKKITEQRYIGAFFSFSWLVHKLHLKSLPFKVELSLLGPNQEVFFSTSSSLQGKLFQEKGTAFPGIYLEVFPGKNSSFFFRQKASSLAVISPIKNTGFQLMASSSREEIKQIQINRYIKNFIQLFLLLFFLGGGITYLFLFLFTKPLKKLFVSMQRVEAGDLSARFTKDRWGFEINLLGEYFNKMMEAMISHQKQAQKEALQRNLLQRELFLAHQIQKGLLPQNLKEVSSMKIATFFSPSFHMGGDFYDFFEIEKGIFLFYIADISGKGMEAGLYALTLRSYVRGAAKGKKDLKELLPLVNELFLQDTEKDSVFATCWMGIYEEKTGILSYACLGHPPAYLIRKAKIEELKTEGLALGVQKEIFEVKIEKVQKKDILFFFTDGLFEAENEKGEFYTLNRLKAYLFSQKEKPLEELMKNLQQELQSYQKEKKDDTAAMALYFH